jgi:hypothetical protein
MIMHRVNGFSLMKIRKYKKLIVSMFQTNANIFYFYHSPTRPQQAIGEFKMMMILALHRNRILCYLILDRGKTVDHNVYLDFSKCTTPRQMIGIRSSCMTMRDHTFAPKSEHSWVDIDGGSLNIHHIRRIWIRVTSTAS